MKTVTLDQETGALQMGDVRLSPSALAYPAFSDSGLKEDFHTVYGEAGNGKYSSRFSVAFLDGTYWLGLVFLDGTLSTVHLLPVRTPGEPSAEARDGSWEQHVFLSMVQRFEKHLLGQREAVRENLVTWKYHWGCVEVFWEIRTPSVGVYVKWT